MNKSKNNKKNNKSDNKKTQLVKENKSDNKKTQLVKENKSDNKKTQLVKENKSDNKKTQLKFIINNKFSLSKELDIDNNLELKQEFDIEHSLSKELDNNYTPLMRQFYKIKIKHPNIIILFRVGDFYEMFDDDAKKGSKILNIVLTKKLRFKYLAGFPYHGLNNNLYKLLKAGVKVAICEQIGNAKKYKKNKTHLIERKIVELITPGVHINEEILDKKKNNFIASLHYVNDQNIGLSLLDFSTGDFFITEGNYRYIYKIIHQILPLEIIYQKKYKIHISKLLKKNYHTHFMEEWMFEFETAYEKVINHFQVKSLKGFGIDNLKLGIIAASIILYYLSEIYYDNIHIKHIATIKQIKEKNYLFIDRFTMKNLEVFNSNNEKGLSLINILDKTITPMGGRLLKQWINFPLKNIPLIKNRQIFLGEFIIHNNILKKVIDYLNQIIDIERLLTKISTNRINPREMWLLSQSLKSITSIKYLFFTSKSPIFQIYSKKIQCFKFINRIINNTLTENPPINIIKGNVILKGVSKKLDNLRNLFHSNKKYIDELCNHEKKITGINKLKISFNNIFGYYFEISNIHKSKVPNYWIHKQSLTKTTRFFTEKLKIYENKILLAEDNILKLEIELFKKLVIDISKYIKLIQTNAKYIAFIDILQSFAISSKENNYVCPEINTSLDLYIKDGRHPILEQKIISNISYIPNNIYLNQKTQQIIIITGPNMSGKSAFLRQVGLIVLMAQIGCYVPAKIAKIGLFDQIFTRLGASDNISLGESTFMVEMNETANIINNITNRSLIILDEIGRGTSTYDGISIATSIIEHIHQHKYRPKTLFATHYHEKITKINKKLHRIKNFTFLVKKNNNNIIFMYKLVPGVSKNSFGIHVAKMAGMPISIINRAEYILKYLTYSNKKYNNYKNQYIKINKKLNFIKKQLNNININQMNYLEFIKKINYIKSIIDL